MKRKEFIKGIGLASLASAGLFIPFGKAEACNVIPTETAGPYPITAGQMAATLRTDVRETQPGQMHKVKLRIIGDKNCAPIPNAEVSIWHCNVDGNYSGFNTNGHISLNATGQNWLKGRAMTDANGEVEFITIFPGWYPGRITHIHLEVKINDTSVKISQFTYPKKEMDIIHTTLDPYKKYGMDPVSPSTDGVFSDGTVGQVATLEFDSITSSWDSFLEVTVPGTGTLGIKNMDRITGGQFELGQNFPNPHNGVTTIPFTLINPADVSFGIYNLQGKKVAEVKTVRLSTGEHKMEINLNNLNLVLATYAYEITVINEQGTHHQCKMMTGRGN